MGNPHTAWVHCSATRPEWLAGSPLRRKLHEITKWHVEGNGWRAVAYNWLIDRDGSEAGGRDIDGDGDFWEEMGAGVRGHNKDTVHICLIGGFGSTENDDPREHFTDVQLAALRARLQWLKMTYPGIKIRGHNEVAAKACPGFNVSRWWNQKSPARESAAQSKAVGAGTVGAVTSVTGGVTAISALEGNAQLVALAFAGVAVLLFLYLIRDRLKKWAAGVR